MYWSQVLQLWNKTKGEDFTGTNLEEPAASCEAYTTQIHSNTRGISHVAPRFDSISQQFAIPGLHSKLTSTLIQKSKVRENNIYITEINPTSCHAFCALFSFTVFHFNFVFQIWIMARQQELELLWIIQSKQNKLKSLISEKQTLLDIFR